MSATAAEAGRMKAGAAVAAVRMVAAAGIAAAAADSRVGRAEATAAGAQQVPIQQAEGPARRVAGSPRTRDTPRRMAALRGRIGDRSR